MTNPANYWRNKKETFSHLNKIGTLISFTHIHNPPKDFGKNSYWVGIIEFDTGNNTKKLITGQLVIEQSTPKIGAQVIGVVRKTRKANSESVIPYGVKFKLL